MAQRRAPRYDQHHPLQAAPSPPQAPNIHFHFGLEEQLDECTSLFVVGKRFCSSLLACNEGALTGPAGRAGSWRFSIRPGGSLSEWQVWASRLTHQCTSGAEEVARCCGVPQAQVNPKLPDPNPDKKSPLSRQAPDAPPVAARLARTCFASLRAPQGSRV